MARRGWVDETKPLPAKFQADDAHILVYTRDGAEMTINLLKLDQTRTRGPRRPGALMRRWRAFVQAVRAPGRSGPGRADPHRVLHPHGGGGRRLRLHGDRVPPNFIDALQRYYDGLLRHADMPFP